MNKIDFKKDVKWIKAYVERQADEGNENRFFKTVTIESNPFEKLIIQPWLEGGEFISATPDNQDPNSPPGHVGWTFNSKNEAIVVLTIEK